jgi:UDP-N-acetylmuramoyl-L-alanyl-D-glutamate--2,6-diaminopimelate ligase
MQATCNLASCNESSTFFNIEDSSSAEKKSRALGAEIAVCENVRQALNERLVNDFAQDLEGMLCVGITGTNGKTTTTFMVASILRAAGRVPIVLGTLGMFCGKEHRTSFGLTTPEAADALPNIREWKKRLGANTIIVEMSSEGLLDRRFDPIRFDVVAITNFTRDHLDAHKTMESYFEAKMILFQSSPLARPIVVSQQLAERVQPFCFNSVEVVQSDEEHASTPMLGSHNRRNAALAARICAPFATKDQICSGLAAVKLVPGRLERVIPDEDIFVDYAHSDDALATVLKAVWSNGKRVIVVFGCGGNRDIGKRPLMGEAAKRHADMVILTSDNPREEDPESIIDDIEIGLFPWTESSLEMLKETQSGFTRIVDRKDAIQVAVSLYKTIPLSVLVIAGRGPDTEMFFPGGVVHRLVDSEIVQACFFQKSFVSS